VGRSRAAGAGRCTATLGVPQAAADAGGNCAGSESRPDLQEGRDRSGCHHHGADTAQLRAGCRHFEIQESAQGCATGIPGLGCRIDVHGADQSGRRPVSRRKRAQADRQPGDARQYPARTGDVAAFGHSSRRPGADLFCRPRFCFERDGVHRALRIRPIPWPRWARISAQRSTASGKC